MTNVTASSTGAGSGGNTLGELVLRLRGLLGGDLLGAIAHQPSWIEASRKQPMLVNVLVIVPDRSVHLARGLYQDEFLRRNPVLAVPLEIVGFSSFLDNLALGDPATVLLARCGEILFDAGGLSGALKERAADGAADVSTDPLRRFLEVKQATHFRNVPFLLARLLNEVYLGAMAAACRRLLVDRERVDFATLEQAAVWKSLPALQGGGAVPLQAARHMERLVKEIRWLVETGSQGEIPEDLLGGEILRHAKELAVVLAVPPRVRG